MCVNLCMKMRLFLILTMALLADSKKDYLTIKKIVQSYTDGSQMEARKFIASEKRSDPALCDACPEVALPANATCDTAWAPQYGQLNAEEDCECLISYRCCPGKCKKNAENACTDNATDNSNVTSRVGSFFTQQGNDCCDCPTAVCVPCPPPVTAGALACGACTHYNAHHSQHNKTMCWESGCKRNKPISYPDPGCDTRCQMNITEKDDCDNDKAICINKPTPFGCKPAKPKGKPCFLQPKKVYQEKFYFSGGTCQKCWVWEVKRKPEGCVQIFPLSESCPAGHKKTSGVTTCNVAREICLPCEETIPNCNKCEEMGTVKDQCGNSVETCVKKSCPSLSQWTGKKCGTLKIGKDSCGCESIECEKPVSLREIDFYSVGGRPLATKESWSNSAVRAFRPNDYTEEWYGNAWAAYTPPQTIWYEFPQPKNIRRMDFQGAQAWSDWRTNYSPEDYSILGAESCSDPGSPVGAKVLASVTDRRYTDSSPPRRHDFDNLDVYKCYGIRVTKTVNTYIMISNIRMWEGGRFYKQMSPLHSSIDNV